MVAHPMMEFIDLKAQRQRIGQAMDDPSCARRMRATTSWALR